MEDPCARVAQAWMDLIRELVAGATTASAGRIAALDHEVLNDPVEAEAVVVAALGEVEKVGHRHRRLARRQGGFDPAFGGDENDIDVTDLLDPLGCGCGCRGAAGLGLGCR